MKTKQLAATAVLAGLILGALPAGAATVTKPVTVKWNTQAVATLTLNTNYSAAGAQQLTAPTILQHASGSGACTPTGAGSEAAATVNFGNVTPDSSTVTDCLYENAVNAQVATNSTNWSLTEQSSAAVPTSFELCALANNSGGTFPFTVAASLPATQTTRAAALANTNTTACASGAQLNTTPFTIITGESTAFTSAAPANLGEDLDLAIGPNAPTGAQLVTVNYTLVAN